MRERQQASSTLHWFQITAAGRKRTDGRRPIADIGRTRQSVVMYQPETTVRRTNGPIFLWIGIGFAAGALAILVAVISGGTGHGSYIAARLLFPFSLLLTRIEGSIGPFSIGVGLLQFPLYGALIGWGVASKVHRGFLVVAAAHVIAILACFSGLLPSFS